MWGRRSGAEPSRRHHSPAPRVVPHHGRRLLRSRRVAFLQLLAAPSGGGRPGPEGCEGLRPDWRRMPRSGPRWDARTHWTTLRDRCERASFEGRSGHHSVDDRQSWTQSAFVLLGSDASYGGRFADLRRHIEGREETREKGLDLVRWDRAPNPARGRSPLDQSPGRSMRPAHDAARRPSSETPPRRDPGSRPRRFWPGPAHGANRGRRGGPGLEFRPASGPERS